MAEKCAYELEREERIRANKLKIQELGLSEAAAELEALKPSKKQRVKKSKDHTVPVEARRSERAYKIVNYAESLPVFKLQRTPVDYSERIKGMSLDAEHAERLRLEMESKRSSGNKAGKQRGPIDSGKGVRIQGGRVYDSKHGVTCHWCRQKTLEDHVTCKNPCCGNGKRMPLSFCAKCLKNRHGEDCESVDASDSWWCPACRGSCGPGCVTCCNCGPCRKKAGLEPTHQVVKLARDAGFNNVHDYLVHLVTGETTDEIAARKLQHSWGAWLKTDSSDASEQTGACCARHSSDDQQQQETGSSKELEDAAPSDKGDAGKGSRATHKMPPRQRPGCGNEPVGEGRKAGGKRKAADVQQQPAEDSSPACDEDTYDAADVPLLSSQDTKLSRKQRIMQKMGLAPVSVC